MFDLERKPDRPFPIERAILFSLVLHVVAFVLFLSMPERRTLPDPRKGLLAAFVPPQGEGPKPPGGPDPYVVPPAGPERQGSGEREQRLAGLDRAIAQAARGISQFPGEQGAGFPNPDGGFKDTGPLSFDTSWYDWGPYAAEMIRRIKLHWEIPELARLGWKGRLTIRFFIRGDGRVEGATILSVSGVPPFDHAALQAILTSSPFRPLPKDLGSDREGVTVTFFYNLRPEDARSNEGGSH